MIHEDILCNSYHAGMTMRYHTWRTINRQSVGEHTWQVMRVWYHLWGNMPPEVSSYILWHDAGELWTGDAPFMAKKASPALKVALDALENEALISMGAGSTPYAITPEQKRKAKICDLIEMMEFGIVELAMGNNFCKPVINVTAQAVRCLVAELEMQDVLVVGAYCRRVFDAAQKYGIELDITPWRPITDAQVMEAAE